MCISKEIKMPPKITKGRKFIMWHYSYAHSKQQKCFGVTGKNYKTKIYINHNLKKYFVLNSQLTYVFLRKWVRTSQAIYEIIFCPSLRNNSIFKSSQSLICFWKDKHCLVTQKNVLPNQCICLCEKFKFMRYACNNYLNEWLDIWITGKGNKEKENLFPWVLHKEKYNGCFISRNKGQNENILCGQSHSEWIISPKYWIKTFRKLCIII